MMSMRKTLLWGAGIVGLMALTSILHVIDVVVSAGFYEGEVSIFSLALYLILFSVGVSLYALGAFTFMASLMGYGVNAGAYETSTEEVRERFMTNNYEKVFGKGVKLSFAKIIVALVMLLASVGYGEVVTYSVEFIRDGVYAVMTLSLVLMALGYSRVFKAATAG